MDEYNMDIIRKNMIQINQIFPSEKTASNFLYDLQLCNRNN